MKRWAVFGAVASMSLVGCVGADGGPGWAASAVVTNECELSLNVKTRVSLDPSDATAKPVGDHVVEPGDREEIALAFRKPVPDEVFVYVAPEGAAQFGAPLVVPTASLEHYVDDDGYEVYVVPIGGEMCPA